MTEDSNITFRYAEEKDCSLILTFIRELATYFFQNCQVSLRRIGLEFLRFPHTIRIISLLKRKTLTEPWKSCLTRDIRFWIRT